MKPIPIFCFWILLVFTGKAQTSLFSQAYGAQSQGMSNTKLFIKNSWSYFNNVGAMDRLDQTEIQVGVDQRFGLQELSTVSFSGIVKKNHGCLGFGISRYGGAQFNQQLLGIGFSNTLGIMSLGAKLDWIQTQIEGFGSGNSLLLSLGGVAQLGPNFFFGANFYNLTQSKTSKYSAEALPTFVQLGLSYSSSPSLSIFSELEKEVDSSPIFKIGIDYSLSNKLFLRTGVSTNPIRLSFGLGLRHNQFIFDYGYGQNTSLGRTHHISMGFKL